MERKRQTGKHPPASVAALGPTADTLHQHVSWESYFFGGTLHIDNAAVTRMGSYTRVSNDRTLGGPQRRHPHMHTPHRTPQLELSAQPLPIPIWFALIGCFPQPPAWTMRGGRVTWSPVTFIPYCKTCLGFQHHCGEGPLENPWTMTMASGVGSTRSSSQAPLDRALKSTLRGHAVVPRSP